MVNIAKSVNIRNWKRYSHSFIYFKKFIQPYITVGTLLGAQAIAENKKKKMPGLVACTLQGGDGQGELVTQYVGKGGMEEGKDS